MVCFSPPRLFPYFHLHPSIWITVWSHCRGVKTSSPVSLSLHETVKFPSTIQPMGFDSSMGPRFCADPFVENASFRLMGVGLHKKSMLPFRPWGLTPQCVLTFAPIFFLTNPADTALTPAARNYFFLHNKLSWALEGTLRAWQLHSQISRFWPAAQNDYFPIFNPFYVTHLHIFC